MSKIRAIIVDDERHSRETTAMLLDMIESPVEIVGQAASAKEGIALIHEVEPELIFLDIQMPGMSGIEMLDYIPGYKGEIIFLTAHDRYAVEAFQKGAIHYLLKPVDPDDLSDAISRIKPKSKGLGNWLSLSSSEGWVVIRKSDIIRCESYKNYTTIVTENAKHTVSKTLKDVEAKLSINEHYRVHNSHLINIQYIRQIQKTDGGNVLMSNGDLIPISKGRKKEFYDWFQSRVEGL